MLTTAELAQVTRKVRRDLDRRYGEARSLALRGKQLTAEVAELGKQVETLERAAAVLSSVGEQRQATAQQQIESLVTVGLQTIFGPGLSFRLVAGMRGKTPVVELVVRSDLDGVPVETSVLDARGGGLAATVGFLLRLVVMLLSKEKNGKILLLDESFSHLSSQFVPAMADFLRELVDRTGVQIILVTHDRTYLDVADCRYEFRLVDGVTNVKEI